MAQFGLTNFVGPAGDDLIRDIAVGPDVRNEHAARFTGSSLP